MFRIFGIKIFEFPPEMPEFLKFGNRLLDYLEAQDQAAIDVRVAARLKAINDRLAAKLNQPQH